jgi:hypothetical protein
METFFETSLIVLAALQPLAWGWCLYSLLLRGASSLKGISRPSATYNIKADNVQINGGR